MERHIYVDGSCCHQKHKGSWAVVDEKNEYSGTLEKLDLDSEYCELFAIYQALLLSRFDTGRVVIHSDNPAVVNLNKSMPDFYKRVKKQGKKQLKNRYLLDEVYRTYNSVHNVQIKQINRRNNKRADRLAKRTLKNYMRK